MKEQKLVEAVLTANMEMLFSRNDFRITFYQDFFAIVENVNTHASATLEIHDNDVIAVQYLMYGDYDDEDMVRCVTRAIKKLKILLKKYVFFINNEFVITDFHEINIIYGHCSFLITNYNGLYSVIKTIGKQSKTYPITLKKVQELISDGLKKGARIDLEQAHLISLVDYVEYTDEE